MCWASFVQGAALIAACLLQLRHAGPPVHVFLMISTASSTPRNPFNPQFMVVSGDSTYKGSITLLSAGQCSGVFTCRRVIGAVCVCYLLSTSYWRLFQTQRYLSSRKAVFCDLFKFAPRLKSEQLCLRLFLLVYVRQPYRTEV